MGDIIDFNGGDGEFCDGMCDDCGCGAFDGYDSGFDHAAYSHQLQDYGLRMEALTRATEVIVAVNQTQAWVPIDTSLMDMFYDFLKGKSVGDPGAATDTETPDSDG